ncbi:hypothetical protein N866_03315 [Actinotalea ferrariae CF5-4]|uniref:Uncharacterized protein n=1 Tax=Actinotalea ferrariae CF5-4 TaxID=948458 RepID=A0A021W0P9_9CELL|nr:hypothetical protein [Actinotalea ferrariae]EYR64882.1 hypothetical protein N866_03315 [Actinotalea ferrariae CF5-4]
MTGFNPADHPRAGSGQFTAKARTEPDITLAAEAGDVDAEYERWETVTRQVAALLPSNMLDDGDGPTIFFGSRAADDNFGDHAFIRVPADGLDEERLFHWQFQTESFPERLPSGYHEVSEVSEHLTIDSDPADVAAWIQEQMWKYKTPPLRIPDDV